MRKLLILVIAVVCLYLIFKRDEPKPSTSPSATSESTDGTDSTSSDEADPSTDSDWGSGHQAGYDWAQEHDITDESDCEEAGDHSNSPSFEAGCKAYVNGE